MKDEAYFHTYLSGQSREHVEAFCKEISSLAEKENITMRQPKYVEVLGMVADHTLPVDEEDDDE